MPHPRLIRRRHDAALFAGLATACGPQGPGPHGQPTGTEVVVALDGYGAAAPLSRRLTVSSDVPVRVEATVTDGTHATTWRFAAFATDHDLPLIGFRPDTSWSVEVALIAEDGTRTTPAPLDAGPTDLGTFPDLEIRALDPSRVAPGYTLLNLRSPGSNDELWVLLDPAFLPMWMTRSNHEIKTILQRADGSFLGIEAPPEGEKQFFSVRDLAGAELALFHSEASWQGTGTLLDGTFGFHHEVIERPEGTLAALAKRPNPLVFDDFPGSYEDSWVRMDNVTVSDDLIVEFDASGAVLRTIDLGELLDPGRIGYDALTSSQVDGRVDWLHANGLSWDPVGGDYLVSFRHQDAVVAIDRETTTIEWILGTPANWGPEHQPLLLQGDADTSWFYHQHAPRLSADRERVMVFDNGNHRASPWDGELDPDDEILEIASRVVEYAIDPVARTARETWSFEPPGGAHSCYAIGSADYLPGGHVLATFGLVGAVDGVMLLDQGLGGVAVRLLEFDPAADNEIVSDLWISAPAARNPQGWQSFAARRIASPYGPDVLYNGP